jgi:hypothetical protein
VRQELLCRLKAYIQPFERQLALSELTALAGVRPTPTSGDRNALEFRVNSRRPAELLANGLAYWEVVQGADSLFTKQSIREATVNVVRNGLPIPEIRRQLPFRSAPPIPNRRALRYGTHGIHEYRGKFFPQLVRALINIAEVPRRGVVIDPMCGSGTTLVEGVLGGYRAVGADINPLSVMITKTKCALLELSPNTLAKAYDSVRSLLLRPNPRKGSTFAHLRRLPEADQRYLQNWFSEDVLRDLELIVSGIALQRNAVVRDFMRLALSNTLRSVSWQKKDDLRVRKEVRLDIEIDPVKEFLEEVGRSVRVVLALLYQGSGAPLGTALVDEVDACSLPGRWQRWRNKADAVITSPPYATALPYLDTDRLSLCYLGLLSRPEHRKRDQLMIGNREITERGRRNYWELFEAHQHDLPDSVRKLVVSVDKLNSRSEVGFRRRNLAALLGKYFLDMRTVFLNIRALLAKGAPAYIVVGDNHTVAGGKHVDIRTADLLMDLAENVGLKPEDRISMEMLVSRDIFRRNAVGSEAILCLRRTR